MIRHLWPFHLFLLIHSKKNCLLTKKVKFGSWQCCLHRSRREVYFKYVSFHWPPLVAALLISYLHLLGRYLRAAYDPLMSERKYPASRISKYSF